ncbi:MAG: IS1634 family transposase [Bacteroidota bacterium]
MYIRQVKKQRSKDSKTFYQYTLAQTLRIEGKVKQNAILYLGAEPIMEDATNRKTVLQILKAKIFQQEDLFPVDADQQVVDLALSYFEKYCLKYGEQSIGAASIPPQPKKAEYHNIDIEGLQAEDVRTFGGEHLCKQVLDKLQLKECLTALGFSHKQTLQALISIAARALFASSEYKTSQLLSTNSSLQACFDYQAQINHRELYAISDQLYQHKDKIDQYLHQHITSMFDLEDKLVIFDISNTYFETRKADSKLAQYGRSKEKRSDCPVVVFTGVINAEGFIRHSNIYEGNKADTATIEDMLEDLSRHTDPSSKQTVVLDAGVASEDNLAMITSKGYHYVCVSRHRIKDYPYDQQDQQVIEYTNTGKSKVKLKVFTPQGHQDTWMYVHSETKQQKEASMYTKLTKNYEQELANIEVALHKKGGTKTIEKVWERIGRAKERNRRVAAYYHIEVVGDGQKITSMSWQKKDLTKTQKDRTEGVYFIRTSYTNTSEKELWQVYNAIREVEATFRCLKSDLQIRPVHHQNDERIEAHIYLTMLAYQLVNTIRHMLKQKDIYHDWKNIVRIMNTQIIQTLILPTDKKIIHLSKPSKPIQQAQQIYQATNCTQTQKAIKKYVVYH